MCLSVLYITFLSILKLDYPAGFLYSFPLIFETAGNNEIFSFNLEIPNPRIFQFKLYAVAPL